MNDILEGLEAIIFDLGGVVIDLHYERTSSVLAQRAGISIEQIGDLLVTSDVLKVFEVGECSEEEFRSGVCEVLGIEMLEDEFDVTWNALLGGISEKRVAAIRELNTRIRTLILSNTNSIHERAFNQQLQDTHGVDGVHGLVQKAYLSHDLGLRKPDVSTYEEVIRLEGLNPQKTLFIDDRLDNIEGAQEAGLLTYHNLQIDDWMNYLKID